MAEGTGFSTGNWLSSCWLLQQRMKTRYEKHLWETKQKNRVTIEQTASEDTSQSQLLGIDKEMKVWKTWEHEYLQHLENSGRKWIILHMFGTTCSETHPAHALMLYSRRQHRWQGRILWGGTLSARAETPRLTLSQEANYIQMSPGSEKNRI